MNKPLRMMRPESRCSRGTGTSSSNSGKTEISLNDLVSHDDNVDDDDDEVKRKAAILSRKKDLLSAVEQTMDSEKAENARTSLRMRNRKEFQTGNSGF